MTFTKTVKDFEAFVQSTQSKTLVLEYFQLKAIAEVTREKIDAIYRPIFEQFEFYEKLTTKRGRIIGDGSRITHPKDLYLCEDEEGVAAYYRACEDEIERLGYNVPRGYCPALTAEHDVIKKENELLEYLCNWMECPVPYNMKQRDKMLDLFLKSVPLKK